MDSNSESFQMSNITFDIFNKEIMRFEPNGDIYVKGKLITNDMEVVEAMKEFLKRGKE